MGGSALAGLLFAIAPVADALWIDGVTFLVSAATLAAIRSSMILAALLLYGLGVAGFGVLRSYPAALVVWGCVGGATVLYNVSTTTLRQRVVPNELLGRVWSIAIVFAWCAIPVGALAGGAIISLTHRIDLVYLAVGLAIATIAVIFNRLALGDAEPPGPPSGPSDGTPAAPEQGQSLALWRRAPGPLGPPAGRRSPQS